MRAVIDPRITVITGDRHAGPNELIGVLEVRADGSCRAAVAERVEVDGRCHIRLARAAWQGKDALGDPVVEHGARRHRQGVHDPQRLVR